MNDEQKIRELVRRVVYRTLGRAGETPQAGGSRLVTRRDVERMPDGTELEVPAGAMMTPLARQTAMEKRLTLHEGPSNPGRAGGSAERTVAVGADHGGYELKNQLIDLLTGMDLKVVDCGTDGPEAVDYPDIALAVARLVADGAAAHGILLDGAGIGSCMAANKVPGVRAALCYDEASAENSREHNHANVLTLGAGLTGAGLATRIVMKWLATPFGGGRHQRRVDKIMDIERRYSRPEGVAADRRWNAPPSAAASGQRRDGGS